MVVLLLLLFAAIVLSEVPDIVRRKMWGELAAFCLYLLIGMVLSIPQALGLSLPSPTAAIEVLFSPLSVLLK